MVALVVALITWWLLFEVIWCRENFGAKSPDCGTRTSIDREWWLLFPVGLWLIAAISWRLLDGCFGGGSYYLVAVAHNGNVRTKSAKNDTEKNGFGPSNAVA